MQQSNQACVPELINHILPITGIPSFHFEFPTKWLYTEITPAAIRNAKGLHLITCLTTNGNKVQILLEELKDIYGLEWTTSLIDIDTDEQKKPWFLKLNPNGKIPVLIDNTGPEPFPVIESEQIPCESTPPLYIYTNRDEKAFHQLSNTADAIERFKAETLRVYNVLELHLSGRLTIHPREYLAGNSLGKFSIADINAYPWVRGGGKRSKISEEEMDSYPHVKKWIGRIESRPGVQRGTSDIYDEDVHPELLISTANE
ncbi:hypothetical protein VN97_g10870 [Penicillium thymicola]|uniref:GST C-terminal domain-containing protein n=1 Tax=Penicillium thymicola TaxID=293382 RepID=A0AAI9T890_PENTH|nr:hypothetical protein VN97_g10870 [Penicillium thymicola]